MPIWAWNKARAISRTWFESFLAVEIGLHLKDFTETTVLWQASLAAIIPVTLRWLNPKDSFPKEE